MGTTSSTASNGSGVINLSRGTCLKAYLAIPVEASSPSSGIILFCDTTSLFFDAPEMRRVVDYMCLASGSMVMSVDMVMSATSPEATSAEKIQDSIFELSSRGATVISVCGFGDGAMHALECASSSFKEVSAACLCCPTPQAIEQAANINIPTILILAGVDDCLSADNARLLNTTLKSSSVPSQLRLYPHQSRGFVDKENIIASTSALNDVLKWFRKYNNDVGPWRIDVIMERIPVEGDWWQGSNEQGFLNVGETNWNKSRQNWRNYNGKKRPSPPKLVPYESVVEGFVEPLRTFELPGRMSLPNMVSVLTDIWEIEGVS